MGLVLVRIALRRGLNTAEQLEGLGVQVMATLPRSMWLWKKTHLHRKRVFTSRWSHRITDVPFLPVDRPADTFVEAVRGLRTSLHFTMQDAANRIVVISGPTQDCGKRWSAPHWRRLRHRPGSGCYSLTRICAKGMSTMYSAENHTGLVLRARRNR
jgi:tyrosine-protein kinase Etk/Wzc